MTLTYDTLHKRDNVKDAKKDFHNFIKRVNRRRKKAGLPSAKYMGAIERKGTNIHFHLIISGGLGRNELEDVWGNGLSNASRLRIDDAELMQRLCQYIMKEARDKEKFENTYICSRNLENPRSRKQTGRLRIASWKNWPDRPTAGTYGRNYILAMNSSKPAVRSMN